jgi:hypothetical protein
LARQEGAAESALADHCADDCARCRVVDRPFQQPRRLARSGRNSRSHHILPMYAPGRLIPPSGRKTNPVRVRLREPLAFETLATGDFVQRFLICNPRHIFRVLGGSELTLGIQQRQPAESDRDQDRSRNAADGPLVDCCAVNSLTASSRCSSACIRARTSRARSISTLPLLDTTLACGSRPGLFRFRF